jgi:hypothetical protein
VKLATAVLRRLAWCTVAVPILAPPTLAQDAQAGESIVVTGSRIRQPGLAATEPVVTMTGQYAAITSGHSRPSTARSSSMPGKACA